MSSLHQGLLSIIIPVVNEFESIPALMQCLREQQGAEFELVVVDGGSTDGTREKLLAFAPTLPFSLRVVDGRRGRARQLNAGVAASRGEFLLFIHADSLFDEKTVLASALEHFKTAVAQAGQHRVAGHFPLRFMRDSARRELSYFYYESKAALDRSGCTHGDQGYLLTRWFWDEVGPFDETVPVLEDTFFAEKVRCRGRWILLPGEILTSARRFEIEGLLARQTLNALIMNFSAIGWEEFFREASRVYRRHDETDRLHLLPYLQLIRRLLRSLPPGARFRLWYRTGRYVRLHAWQLAFFIDVYRAYRSGNSSTPIDTTVLNRFAPIYEKTTDNIPGRFAATILVWTWFHLALLWCLFRQKD